MALTDVPVELSSTPGVVDNSNTTAITIDSSENVGLGTVPSGYLTNGYILRLNGGTQTYLGFNNTTHTTQVVGGFVIGNDASAARITQRENQPLIISTNDTDQMHIDASGNVGIGVTPEAWHSAFTEVLQVGVASLITSGGDNARVFSNAYYDGAYKRIGTGYAHSYEQTGGTHRWFSAASGSADSSISWAESMRIDESSKLLVGTTSGSGSSAPDNSSSASDAGVRISGDGYIGIGNNTNQSLYLNIIGADGAIADFRKNGTTVGYISTIGGDFVIGSTSGSDAGLRMDGTNNQIYPSNATGSSRDNAISLGASNVRFKDLYLSGGINFGDASGGTSYSAGNVANLLDDYEEGSWTPTIAHNDGSGAIGLNVAEASYVKIGGLVYVRGYLTLVNPNGNAGTSSPYYGIRGFPFAPTNYGTWMLVYTSGGNASYGGYTSVASFYFLIPDSDSPHGTGHVSGTAFNGYGSNLTMMFDAVYRTNA